MANLSRTPKNKKKKKKLPINKYYHHSLFTNPKLTFVSMFIAQITLYSINTLKYNSLPHTSPLDIYPSEASLHEDKVHLTRLRCSGHHPALPRLNQATAADTGPGCNRSKISWKKDCAIHTT